MLREQVCEPAIENDIDRAWKNYPKGFVAFLQPGEVPPGGKGLAQYLAKYLTSPPIAVRRIEHYDGESIRYCYEDHKTEATQHETLPILRFIGRMVQHILPKGFQRIRYYGLHGHVRYEKMRDHLAQVVPSDTPPDPRGFRVLPPSPFVERIRKSFGHDPLTCPRCGDHMALEFIYHPKYGIVKDYGLFEPEHPLDGLEPTRESARVATGNAQGNALASTSRMGQIPLPFL
jgi:hypothetical protein